jgi:hypothetical protein
MVKSLKTPVIDLGPDEYRGANSLPPKRDRVLPGTIMAAGLAIFAAVALSPIGPAEQDVHFMIVVAAALSAAAFGWGSGGLLRPYKLVPKGRQSRRRDAIAELIHRDRLHQLPRPGWCTYRLSTLTSIDRRSMRANGR